MRSIQCLFGHLWWFRQAEFPLVHECCVRCGTERGRDLPVWEWRA